MFLFCHMFSLSVCSLILCRLSLLPRPCGKVVNQAMKPCLDFEKQPSLGQFFEGSLRLRFQSLVRMCFNYFLAVLQVANTSYNHCTDSTLKIRWRPADALKLFGRADSRFDGVPWYWFSMVKSLLGRWLFGWSFKRVLAVMSDQHAQILVHGWIFPLTPQARSFQSANHVGRPPHGP